jgi:hypothetical protein
MHHLTTTLIDLHERLDEAGKLLEQLAKEMVDLTKENAELRQKLFFTDIGDDGKC